MWGFEVHRTGSRIDLLWLYAFVDGNDAVLGANNGSGPGDAYQHHNIVPQAMFQMIKELYIQVTDPSVLIISSAVQNKNECYNDVANMWQLCPQIHSVVLNLWRVNTAAFSTKWCNELAVTIQHILQDWDELGNWCLYGQGPDQPPCTSRWAEGSQCSEKGSEVKEEEKKRVTG